MKQYTNPINAVSIQFEESPLLTFHNDGRVTTGSKLKPDKTAARVLDHIKNQWFKDAQATKIRELQEQNDLLEDWKQSALAVEREWNANAIATMLGSKLGESQREVVQREVPKLLARIKELEAVINDPEALWTNWLRGDVKLPSGIGDVRQYQERIKRLEEAGNEIVDYNIGCGCGHDGPCRACRMACEAWEEAKEAKL